MPRVAPVVPEEATLLCEGCGYILTGLPADGRCPECAKPIAESAAGLRRPPPWELARPGRSTLSRFLATTIQILWQPARFYRSLSLRATGRASGEFAQIHWITASLLGGVGILLQIQWVTSISGGIAGTTEILGVILISAFATYVMILLTTRLTSRLTAWEAAYRGLRLPLHVIRRGMDYHAAHYLPVALVFVLTTAIYRGLLWAGTLDERSGPRYLYLLCGGVILAAIYLFEMYWIGMRRLIYANG